MGYIQTKQSLANKRSRCKLKHFTEEQYAVGSDAEKRFASHLTNAVWSTKEEDMLEHWDVKGILPMINNQELKFDVKAIKNVIKFPNQDECTWVEGTNVMGDYGWIKGDADYIVFEKEEIWFIVSRKELLDMTMQKLKDNNYKTGSGIYIIHQRPNKKDRITLVPFKDMKTIKHYELTK